MMTNIKILDPRKREATTSGAKINEKGFGVLICIKQKAEILKTPASTQDKR